MHGRLNVKLQMTIWRKQGQLHPDERPYCCCTPSSYIVLKGTRMRRVILLFPNISTVWTATALPVPGPWCWMLCRRNHYIKITMREESHTRCLYSANRGKMRVGGRRLWACSFYVHPQLATPTKAMEEVSCCKDSHYRTHVLFSHIVFVRNCVSTELGEHMLCNITYPDVCESTNITDNEAVVPGAQVAFVSTHSSYISSRANERGIFP